MSEKNDSNKFSFIKKYLTKTVVKYIVFGVVLFAVAFGIGRFSSSKSDSTKLGFQDIGELSTQAAYCTEVNMTEEARNLYGIKIPFTQSKYIYSYDIVIKAGFDFKEINFNVNEKNKTINVSLPQPKILSSDVNPESFKLYHEDESIFTQMSLKGNNEALIKLREGAEKTAIENGLLENAKTNGELILTGFFASEYNLKEYKIEFSYQ